MSETEISRLVVRLLGDSADFQRMIDGAVKTAVDGARRVEESSKGYESVGKAANDAGKATSAFAREEQIAQDLAKKGARLTADASVQTQTYASRVNELNNLLDTNNISQEVYNKTLQKYQQDADAAAGATGSLSSALFTVGATMVGIGAAITGLFGSLAHGMLQSASRFEETKVSFGTMLGSAQQAEDTLARLTQFAAETPYTMPQIEQAARGLIQFGERGDKMMGTLKLLGNAASATATDFGMIGLIFNQIRGVGHLLTQDFRQLSSRGVLSMQDLADHFKKLGVVAGSTTTGVQTMLSAGKISFEDVRQTFEELSGTGGRFEGMMEKQSQTYKGLMSTLSDNVNIALRGIGEQLVMMSKPFIQFAIDASKAFMSWSTWVKASIAVVIGLGTAVGAFLVSAGGLSLAVGGLIVSFSVLSPKILAAAVSQGILTATEAASTPVTLGLTGAVIGHSAAMAMAKVGAIALDTVMAVLNARNWMLVAGWVAGTAVMAAHRTGMVLLAVAHGICATVVGLARAAVVLWTGQVTLASIGSAIWSGVLWVLSGFMVGFTAVTGAATAVTALFWTTVTLGAVVIVAAVAGLYTYISGLRDWNKEVEKSKKLNDDLIAAMDATSARKIKIGGAIEDPGEQKAYFEKMVKTAEKAVDDFKPILEKAQAQTDWWFSGRGVETEGLTKQFENLKKVLKEANDALLQAGGLEAINNAIAGAESTIADYRTQLKDVQAELRKFADTPPVGAEQQKAFEEATKKAKDLENSIAKVNQQLKEIEKMKESGVTPESQKWIDDMKKKLKEANKTPLEINVEKIEETMKSFKKSPLQIKEKVAEVTELHHDLEAGKAAASITERLKKLKEEEATWDKVGIAAIRAQYAMSVEKHGAFDDERARRELQELEDGLMRQADTGINKTIRSLDRQAGALSLTGVAARMYAEETKAIESGTLPAFKARIDDLTAAYQKLETSTFNQQLKEQAATLGMTAKEAANYQLKLKGFTDAQIALKNSLDMRKTVDDLTRSLREQAATMNMTQDEVARYKLQIEGATDAQLEMVKASQASVRGAEIMKKHQSPMVAFNKRREELNDLLARNVIGTREFGLEMQKAQEELSKVEGTHRVELKVGGVDALQAGTSEALQALDDYRAGLRRPLVMGAARPDWEMPKASQMPPVTVPVIPQVTPPNMPTFPTSATTAQSTVQKTKAVEECCVCCEKLPPVTQEVKRVVEAVKPDIAAAEVVLEMKPQAAGVVETAKEFAKETWEAMKRFAAEKPIEEGLINWQHDEPPDLSGFVPPEMSDMSDVLDTDIPEIPDAFNIPAISEQATQVAQKPQTAFQMWQAKRDAQAAEPKQATAFQDWQAKQGWAAIRSEPETLSERAKASFQAVEAAKRRSEFVGPKLPKEPEMMGNAAFIGLARRAAEWVGPTMEAIPKVEAVAAEVDQKAVEAQFQESDKKPLEIRENSVTQRDDESLKNIALGIKELVAQGVARDKRPVLEVVTAGFKS
jgi:tape measure protein